MSLVSGISLKELATKIGADLEGDPKKEVSGLNTLDLASKNEVAFIARESFLPSLSSTKAGALICSIDLSNGYTGNKLIGEDPYLLYAKCTKVFKDLADSSADEGISDLVKVGKNTSISVKGRHDPCVGIRAVPIGEAMMHCVILDHYLMNKAQCS